MNAFYIKEGLSEISVGQFEELINLSRHIDHKTGKRLSRFSKVIDFRLMSGHFIKSINDGQSLTGFLNRTGVSFRGGTGVMWTNSLGQLLCKGADLPLHIASREVINEHPLSYYREFERDIYDD